MRQKLKNTVLGSFAALSLVACGEAPSEYSSVPEYLQNVNFIPYRLTSMTAQLQVQGLDGESRNLQLQFQGSDLQDEQVARVTQGEGYTLQINEKISNIEVGASSRLAARGGQREVIGGCEVIMSVEAQGVAEYNRLDLDYHLRSELKGRDCGSGAWERQAELVGTQLESLGLHQTLQMREAELLFLEQSTRFDLRVRMSGIARIPE